MTPYKLERNTSIGKALYAYADKQKGVVYIGGDEEYQRYKLLGIQQSIAQKNELEDYDPLSAGCPSYAYTKLKPHRRTPIGPCGCRIGAEKNLALSLIGSTSSGVTEFTAFYPVVKGPVSEATTTAA
jgi:hypothetical protein